MKITSRRKNVLMGVGIFLAVLLGFWIVLRDRPPRYNEPLAGRQSGTPLADDSEARGMWPDKVDQDDTALMMVAFSGGGSRAAAVAWKTLETLKRIPYTFTADGRQVESNLAREIDLVAGISGGSFAAAAWCLWGGDLAAFQKRFVERTSKAPSQGIYSPVRASLPHFPEGTLESISQRSFTMRKCMRERPSLICQCVQSCESIPPIWLWDGVSHLRPTPSPVWVLT